MVQPGVVTAKLVKRDAMMASDVVAGVAPSDMVFGSMTFMLMAVVMLLRLAMVVMAVMIVVVMVIMMVVMIMMIMMIVMVMIMLIIIMMIMMVMMVMIMLVIIVVVNWCWPDALGLAFGDGLFVDNSRGA